MQGEQGIINRRYLRVKAFQALYAYEAESTTLDTGQRNMLKSIDQIYDLYIYLLQLVVEVHHRAELNIEQNKHKQLKSEEDINPNMKFVENRAIAILRDNIQLKEAVHSNKINWGLDPHNVRTLWKNIRESDIYKEYMESGKSSFEEDQKCIVKLFKKHIALFDDLHEYLENASIYRQDDLGLLLINVIQTISRLTENTKPEDDILFPLYKEKKEDIKFVTDLFRKTILNDEELKKLVDKSATNWDYDRIARLDTIVLKMAVCEFLYFPSIPVKVTINEYIELAKDYSTPNSTGFVNGVLDRMSQQMLKEGAIVKSGRGLIG